MRVMGHPSDAYADHQARVAKLADAEGLNPSEASASCGFEPRPGHPPTRENVDSIALLLMALNAAGSRRSRHAALVWGGRTIHWELWCLLGDRSSWWSSRLRRQWLISDLDRRRYERDHGGVDGAPGPHS